MGLRLSRKIQPERCCVLLTTVCASFSFFPSPHPSCPGQFSSPKPPLSGPRSFSGTLALRQPTPARPPSCSLPLISPMCCCACIYAQAAPINTPPPPKKEERVMVVWSKGWYYQSCLRELARCLSLITTRCEFAPRSSEAPHTVCNATTQEHTL